MTKYKLDNSCAFEVTDDQINIFGPDQNSLSLSLKDFQRIAIAVGEASGGLPEFDLEPPYLEELPLASSVRSEDGTRRYYMGQKLHRADGPAVDETPDGRQEWWLNGEWQRTAWRNEKGELHLENAPAIVRANGDQLWYKNNRCHRKDGPAVERSDGYKVWYRHGRRHRKDGPAVVRPDGVERWYWDGKKVTPEQHERIVKALCVCPNIIMGPVTPMPMVRKKTWALLNFDWVIG